MTQIKVLYNFRRSQSKLLNFKEQNQNDQIAINLQLNLKSNYVSTCIYADVHI